MREIKFRAWDKKLQKMHNVHGWFETAIYISEQQIPHNPRGKRKLDDVLLMQFTGLKDKKRTAEYPEGQEIYEGDIVDFVHSSGYNDTSMRDVVEFKDGEFLPREMAWETNCDVCSEDDDGGHTDYHEHKDFVVIGNIYENPELLKS